MRKSSRKRLCGWTAALLVTLGGPAAASTPTCVPSFPYQQGWYGADSAASIPLSRPGEIPARTLWLFGDSFVSPSGAEDLPNRWGTRFVNNTAAHGTCDAHGAWSVDYLWNEEDGLPAPVFPFEDDPTGRIFYWPLAGANVDGAAYVLLVAVRNNLKNARFQAIDDALRARFPHLDDVAFGVRQRRAFTRAARRLGGDRVVGVTPALAQDDDPFTLLGTAIARVTNPEDPSRDWDLTFREVSRSRTYFPAGAAVVSDGFLYLLGWRQPGAFGVGMQFLARIPLAVVRAFPDDLADAVEVFGEAGWGGPSTVPRILMTGTPATEMGLQPLPESCGWLVSQMGAFEPLTAERSDHIAIRTARELEGPWSEQRLVGRAPERSPDAVTGDTPFAVCYAAKTHPHLSPPERLLYTYICNTFGSEEAWAIMDRMDLYTPRSISVSLPPPGNARDIAPVCPWRVPDATPPEP